MNIFFTVCNRTNLAHALALADSVLEYQQDHIFYLCWVDTLPLTNIPVHIKVLNVSEIELTELENMSATYFDFELLAACRPWFALELLKREPKCRLIGFFAPTVRLFSSFEHILRQQADIYLTPNIVKPLPVSNVLDDKRILNIGMYHAGSWILRPGADTIQMLKWWAARTADRAKFNLCEGMNMDQLWLNYVPLWIKNTITIRQTGWHFGLRAVLNTKLSIQNGKYLVDQEELISVDFAGLDYFDPVWSNHAALLSHNTIFKVLFKKYKNGLQNTAAYLGQGSAPTLGKTLIVKKKRVFRNNLANKLKAIVTYIDQF